MNSARGGLPASVRSSAGGPGHRLGVPGLAAFPALVVLGLLAGAPDGLHGQRTPAPVRDLLVPGARVRVTSPAAGLSNATGTLARVGADTLVVALAAGPPRALVRSRIEALDVADGTRRRILRGGLLGLGAGLALAAAAEALGGSCPVASVDGTCAPGNLDFPDVDGGVVLGTSVAAGLVVGALVRTVRWRAVPPGESGPALRVGPAPAGRGWRPGIAVAWALRVGGSGTGR